MCIFLGERGCCSVNDGCEYKCRDGSGSIGLAGSFDEMVSFCMWPDRHPPGLVPGSAAAAAPPTNGSGLNSWLLRCCWH